MKARFYSKDDAAQWDEFLKKCPNATFLHTRRFLSYHKNKFVDRSIILELDGQLIGLLPAAEMPKERHIISSHPGLTYGGILHQGMLRGERMKVAFDLIRDLLAKHNYHKLRYKAIPFIYHTTPLQDDLYYLFRIGGRKYRSDLSSCIRLDANLMPSSRRIRSIKRAKKFQVELVSGLNYAAAIWDVLSENLELKYKLKPTHSLQEILELYELFPENISFIAARYNDTTVAGLVLFRCGPAIHVQYIASNEVGKKISALDLLFSEVISYAKKIGVHYFDFGISTEANGTKLNEGLYQFKNEFGSGGIVYEFFDLDLG